MAFIAMCIVVTALVLFVLYMLVVTASCGTENFKTAQFLLTSLTYSEEADVKINLLLDKREAGLLHCQRETKELKFFDADGVFAGSIWVGTKYYSYGNLYRYGAEHNKTWACNKPKIKTFKRIVKLEKTLELGAKAQQATPKAETKPEKKGTEEVILD